LTFEVSGRGVLQGCKVKNPVPSASTAVALKVTARTSEGTPGSPATGTTTDDSDTSGVFVVTPTALRVSRIRVGERAT
jgi:hypothetical protein